MEKDLVTYRSSIHNRIATLFPEYRFSEPLGDMLRTLSERQLDYLWALTQNKNRESLTEFIRSHIL